MGVHDGIEGGLIGLDRPGIVRDVSGVLAAKNVSIVELESERVNGSFSGEAMFKARARLKLPSDLDLDELASIEPPRGFGRD